MCNCVKLKLSGLFYQLDESLKSVAVMAVRMSLVHHRFARIAGKCTHSTPCLVLFHCGRPGHVICVRKQKSEYFDNTWFLTRMRK